MNEIGMFDKTDHLTLCEISECIDKCVAEMVCRQN